MSAFNQARYNLSKFNIAQPGQVWASGTAKTSFSFSFAGETVYFRGSAAVRFNSEDIILNRGRIFKGSSSETFSQQAKCVRYCNIAAVLTENFNKDLYISQNAYIICTGSEIFDAETELSQEAYSNGTLEESFDADPYISQLVFTHADIGEVFASTADVISLSETVCEFPELILKPGQTLVIDANSYNVLLDGQNAIHLQKGAWLDDMTRNTQTITITATNSGRLEAEILYTERYL